MENRDYTRTVSVAKTICMLLVVLGHACVIYRCVWGGIVVETPSAFMANLNRFVGTFHTYFFIFASGYLFSLQRYGKGKYRSPAKDLCNRTKRLIVPYIGLSLFWAIPFAVVCERLSVIDIIKKYVLMLDPAQLWFLITSFELYVIFYFISDFLVKKPPVLSVGMALLIFYVNNIVVQYLPITVFGVWNTLRYFLFFLCGMLFQYRQKRFRMGRLPLFLLATAVEAVCITAYFLVDGIVYSILLPFVSLVGIFWVFSFTQLVQDRLQKSRIFACLTKESMGIYLIHQQIMYLVLRSLNYPGVSPVVVLCAGTVLCLPISYAISHLLNKTKIGRLLLGNTKTAEFKPT